MPRELGSCRGFTEELMFDSGFVCEEESSSVNWKFVSILYVRKIQKCEVVREFVHTDRLSPSCSRWDPGE